MNLYEVTRTYWKTVEVKASSRQEAIEKANTEDLFANVKLFPAEYDEAEEIKTDIDKE